MQRSFIKNVKECTERSILFIKNAKERKNIAFFRKERKRTQEHCVLLKRTHAHCPTLIVSPLAHYPPCQHTNKTNCLAICYNKEHIFSHVFHRTTVQCIMYMYLPLLFKLFNVQLSYVANNLSCCFFFEVNPIRFRIYSEIVVNLLNFQTASSDIFKSI